MVSSAIWSALVWAIWSALVWMELLCNGNSWWQSPIQDSINSCLTSSDGKPCMRTQCAQCLPKVGEPMSKLEHQIGSFTITIRKILHWWQPSGIGAECSQCRWGMHSQRPFRGWKGSHTYPYLVFQSLLLEDLFIRTETVTCRDQIALLSVHPNKGQHVWHRSRAGQRRLPRFWVQAALPWSWGNTMVALISGQSSIATYSSFSDVWLPCPGACWGREPCWCGP